MQNWDQKGKPLIRRQIEFLTCHHVATIMLDMVRPEMTIRFRTKKDYLEAKRQAKAQRLSLNEYILRCVEDSIVTPPPPAERPRQDASFGN